MLATLVVAHCQEKSGKGGYLPRRLLCGCPQDGDGLLIARYEEAVAVLRTAAEQPPGQVSAFAGFFLAMSHHQRGEHDEAQAAFQRAGRKWKPATDIDLPRRSLLEALW